MTTHHSILIKSISFILLTAVTGTAQAYKAVQAHEDEEPTEIEFVQKYGRSATEYFFSPIVGINYTDITSLNSSFLNSDTRTISQDNPNGNGTININQNEPGAVVGFLIDGQYQITATDYWRGGFQTGLIYTSPIESKFQIQVCEGANNSGCSTPEPENGHLKTSSLELPVLFTFSRYAQSDRYISTFKLGPVITYQMYDLNFEGFDITPNNETEILIAAGLDGRYRLGESDNFLLAGFLATAFLGGNNDNFSGVQNLGDFSVYLGLSFS